MAWWNALREWGGTKRKPLQASSRRFHFFHTNPSKPGSSVPFEAI
jgi:hypothetical protein